MYSKIILLVILIGLTKINTSSVPKEETFSMPSDFPSNWSVKGHVYSITTIKIKSNTTTGYKWFLKNHQEANAMIELLNIKDDGSSTDHTAPYIQNMVGVSGFQYFKFTSTKATNPPIKLTFEQKRPWESTPLRIVDVDLNFS